MREDVKIWLDRFDNGEDVPSLEMGGIGVGYEQAIQICAAELIRHEATTNEKVDEVVRKIDEKLWGLTGAQVGQASWLANYMLQHGPDALREAASKRGEEDRCILINNAWPPLGIY